MLTNQNTNHIFDLDAAINEHPPVEVTAEIIAPIPSEVLIITEEPTVVVIHSDSEVMQPELIELTPIDDLINEVAISVL